MKRIIEIISILSLFIFSFFITDKTISMVKENDEIMINIKQEYKKYNTKSIDAIIKNNTIIPGISGRIVNIDKSYKAMKEYGKYNDKLYVYNYIKPKISIQNHKDKIIINGNKNYRKVSIIILLQDHDSINSLLNIIKDNDIKISFFITDTWLLNNNALGLNLIKDYHTIGINAKENIKWMNTVIKKIGKQKNGYCLSNNKRCLKLNNYLIKPIIINNHYLLNVQNILSNGNMFLFRYNTLFEEEFISIIRYINSKGYDIVSLEQLLQE